MVKRNGRILCYHSVGTPQWGVNDVSPARFRRQLEDALLHGYRFVSAERIARGEGGPKDLALTFDDGLTSVARNAAPLLADLGVPWTLFVVSDWAEGKHHFGADVLLDWRGIERVVANGAAIGSHSVSHPDFGRLAPHAAREELFESRRMIERRLGMWPTAFAIPLGGSRNWTMSAASSAREVGYRLVYAQSEERRPPGTVARTFVTRFDGERLFRAALAGAFDGWEEWLAP